MAGDWIKMRIDLMEDPAVMQMADELGVREEAIVGYCHALWSWVSRQCHADSVTGVTLVSLGRRIGVPGFPELLVDVGWLEYDESGDRPVITIPNFERHLSESAKKRALSNERKRKQRAKMSRTERDKSVTTEEKRREENIYLSLCHGFEDEWKRWCDYFLATQGRDLDQISAETTLMELSRRGPEKAAKDITFSILKNAKSILDSDNDLSKRNQTGKSRNKLRI